MAILETRGLPMQNREYCIKDGDFVEVGVLSEMGKRNDLVEIKRELDSGASLDDIADRYFSQWIRYRASFKEYIAMKRTRIVEPKYALDSFYKEWIDAFAAPIEKATIIWGDSGIGKTCFAKALLPGALLVSHQDDLLHFKKEKHNGIIFDDMEFGHHPRTSQIHYVDTDDDRSLHCRYQCAFIPAGTPKIFTSNTKDGKIFDLDDPAIRRRVRVVYLGVVDRLGEVKEG